MYLNNIIVWGIIIIWNLPSMSAPVSTEKFAEELGKYVSSGYVDYKNWSKDHEGLDEFMKSLETAVLDSLSADEYKALLINAYNAGMIWLILREYPIESVFEIKPKVFEQQVINIAGRMLSLDDIEQKYLGMLGDNRIHFAIVCGSVGCPDLSSQIYEAENLDERLDDAARKYLSQPRGLVIEEDTGEVLLSMLFDWYSADFGSSRPAVLKALSQYMPEQQAEYVRENASNVKVRFIDYDWSLNGD